MSVVAPVGTVAVLAYRGSLRGLRASALAAFAAVPALLALALISARTAPSALASELQILFVELTIPIVAVVIILILSVGQFRTEIDDDTLSYLTSRSIPRWGIVVGKYVGSVGAGLTLLLPGALAPFALAWAAGAPSPPSGAVEAIVAITVLATVAYGALFLFLGLLTAWALLMGLLLGFLWEQLLLRLPGSVPKLTVAYYLQSLGGDLVSTGPLAGGAHQLTVVDAVAGPLLAAIVFVALAMFSIRYLELVPERSSA